MLSCKLAENHFSAANSTRPKRRFSLRDHRKAHIKPLIYSPTAGVASLNFLTHTHLPPSFSCNRSSLLSWPAPHSPLSLPPFSSSSFTVIQPPGSKHRRHSWRRLRSEAFIQTAGLLWSLHRSTPWMHYLSEQVSWHRELVILRRS